MRQKTEIRPNAIFNRLRRDIGGSVALWAAIALPVMSAGAALSVDVARLQNLDHDLQSASDALARAGASELDQAPDSITRAERAIKNLVSNTKRGDAISTTDVEIADIRFLTRLPSPSWSPVTQDMITTDATQAMYVEVNVKPETVNTIFPTSTLGKFSSVTLDARSVAGVDIGICGSAPIFICNPFEGSGMSIREAAVDGDFQRRQITLIAAGPNASYAPGNFGWLDPFDNNSGASVLRDEIARTVSRTCVSKTRGVSLRPGRVASMRQGFNTKFDIYEGSFRSESDNPEYAPAQNVVKGQANGGVCGRSNAGGNAGRGRGRGRTRQSADDVLSVTGFGPDQGSDATLGSRVGNGDWDFLTYMTVNHPGTSRITLDGVTYSINAASGRVTPATPPSRYSVYRWEIDTDCVPGKKSYGNQATSPEEGQPICNTHLPPAGVDPRILSVAVLNCNAIQDAGIDMNGRSSGIPVETFVKVFVTNPMGQGQDNVIHGEIIGEVQPRSDISSSDRVALVR